MGAHGGLKAGRTGYPQVQDADITVHAYGWYEDEVFLVDVESEAIMNSSVVEVKPFLISRNTLGNGNRNSKSSQMRKVGIFKVNFLWRQMVVVMIYVDGGCQELPNERKNMKTGLRG